MMPIALKITLLSLAGLLILATVLPLWRHDAWWVRACDFPSVQLVFTGLIVLLVYIPQLVTGISWAEKVTLGLMALCLVYQVIRIYPYTPLATKQSLGPAAPQPRSTLSILVANVLMDNRQADRLLDLVREHSPDLLLTVETDAWWAEQLADLDDEYPHQVLEPLDNTYGMLLHSRLPLIEPEVKFLLEDDIPSIHAGVRLESGEIIQIHGLHPRPPYPAESLETTERDAELLNVGREIGDNREVPTLLMGDFNDVAWSYTTRLLQKISGLLDPRIGRGLYSTYSAHIPLMRWPLDHIFHSTHFKLVSLQRLPAFGSDHFPVYAEFSLEPQAPLEQEEPVPEPEDVEEAEEKIEEGEPLDVPPTAAAG